MRALLLTALLTATFSTAPAAAQLRPQQRPQQRPGQQSGQLYATVLMRAAPGHLMELIDLVKRRADIFERSGEHRPLILRHSQGDHWDLMIIQPVGSLEEHYEGTAIQRRLRMATQMGLPDPVYERRLREMVSWREETFYTGPPAEEFMATVAPPAGYFHVEMFIALAGRHDELYRERQMENDYLDKIGRPQNLIFRKTLGGPWDCFTLGLFRDLEHFAEGSDVTPVQDNQAARAAGFQSAAAIGPYMRTLILRHNDTLGRIVR